MEPVATFHSPALSPHRTPAPPTAARPLSQPGTKPRLLDRVRNAIRLKHYSIRTEDTYVHWVRRYILFHGKRHPAEINPEFAIPEFLTHLAVNAKVAASTQNQALNALVFLYKHVLETEIGDFDRFVRAKLPTRMPVVLSRPEVAAIYAHLAGPCRLVVGLLYGSVARDS